MKYTAVITLTSELDGELDVNIAFDPPLETTEDIDKMPICQSATLSIIQYMKENLGNPDGEFEDETN